MNARDVIVATGWAMTTCFALCAFHFYSTRDDGDDEEWKKREMKKRGVDRLKIHKNLIVGVQTRTCDVHEAGELRCDDLTCRHGPMSYIARLIDGAEKSLDIAVYIIYSRIVSEAIIGAHQRGVRVRIICDSEMAFKSQSSIMEFKSLGLEVRRKMSPYIMHHKFLILDEEIVASGSMNFTNTAFLGNWENVIVTSTPNLVQQFVDEFERLWEEFGHYSAIEEDNV